MPLPTGETVRTFSSPRCAPHPATLTNVSRRPVDFYEGGGYDEDRRLERPNSRLEFLRTQELLRARLPAPPATVLDVGGGTGVHARWPAEDGYDVTLIDLVPAHVEAASRHVEARVGDARELDVETRHVRCVPAAWSALPPARAGGSPRGAATKRRGSSRQLVFAAAISRFAWPLYALRDGAALDDGAIAETFRRDPRHRRARWPLFDAQASPDLLDRAVRTARLCDGHAELVAASAHLTGLRARHVGALNITEAGTSPWE